MELYILNELIELEGELPEVVNYIYKSLDELNEQIRYKVACWQDEFLGDEPVPQDDEVEFTPHNDGTGHVRFFGSYVTFSTYEFDTDDL